MRYLLYLAMVLMISLLPTGLSASLATAQVAQVDSELGRSSSVEPPGKANLQARRTVPETLAVKKSPGTTLSSPPTLTNGPVSTTTDKRDPKSPPTAQGQKVVKERKPLTKTLNIGAKGISIHFPEGWSPARNANVYKLLRAPAEGLQSLSASAFNRTAQIMIYTEHRKDHAEAVKRLREIALEYKAPPVYINVGGWPALERRLVLPREQPGKEGDRVEGSEMLLRITTAIAADDLLVRIESRLEPDATVDVIDEVEAISRSLVFVNTGDPARTDQEIQNLRQNPAIPTDQSFTPLPKAPSFVEIAEGSSDSAGAVSRVTNAGGRDSELEMAVSTNGQKIVIGSNTNYFFSSNGGQSFTQSNIAVTNDPSLAFGQSTNFYAANISTPSTRIDFSTDGGANFNFRGNAFTCPAMGPNQCGAAFPDQEHIAADRFNAAPGGDQVYSAWRQLNGNVGIVCSADGGQNWTATPDFQPGDFPRVTVGQDGFVYMVWLSGNNIMLAKYNSCQNNNNNMNANLLFTQTVATGVNGVACPVPGLDRCNGRNTLSSQTVVVDDTNANHVYVAYADNTAPGGANCTNQNTCNENVVVRDSIDGGANWPNNSPGVTRVVTVSSGITARRFMPWLCSVGGAAYVSWYDRRLANTTNNDLTDFFRGSAFLNALGNLQVGTELQVNQAGTADAQCAAGQMGAASWPGGTNAMTDSESCSIQPQLAGRCGTVSPCCAPGDSNQACDFSSGPACPAMGMNGPETCRTTRGSPKYGDYNGSACAAGRFYNTWASAVSPPGIAPASTDIDIFFSSTLVCCVPQIQVPGGVNFADTCVGSTSTQTLNVCNTGKADLQVNSITSNNTQFTVTTPSSGYSVVISPDFCFPFQVNFTPSSQGAKTATLTIASNDTVNPSVTVQATGNGSQQNISTVIADNGDFGNVCVGSFKDLDLTINNPGGCDLSISNITSNSGEFKTAQTMSFPLVVQGGTSIHVPIRFQPTSTGGPKNANITITSNAPAPNNTKVVAVTGHSDPGHISVTGSTDFGDVCAGALAEKTVSICNVGACNLHVTSVSLGGCTDFQIINNPFPATVSPDSCLNLVIRFTPTSAGPKTCTLTINSDDPNTPVIMKTVTANTPGASIDVSPDQSFLPEVVQSLGTCRLLQPFPISNKGTCNLKITSVTIGGTNATDFGLSALPSSPIILQPGHTVGDGALMTVFAPTAIARARLGTLTVMYESDPITHATASVTRNLCGEGVNTGARVLVTAGGVPLANVERIHLQRINANRNKNNLDTIDNAMNLPLVTVTPAAPCTSFQYHREYGTVSNPIQLLPGSYQVTVTAIVNGKRRSLTVGFNVNTCDFNPTIVVNFP